MVDELVKDYESFKSLKKQTDDLRAKRNIISQEINDLKKAKKDASAQLKQASEIPKEIAELEEDLQLLNVEINKKLLQIPNLLDLSVPEGKEAADNVEVKKWGKIPKYNFELVSHTELIEKMGYAEFEAGRQNAGQGFNYLIDEMAVLDNALQRYGVDCLLKKGFKLVVPPLMLNFETLLGALNGLQDFEQVVYKVDKEDLYLIGTAEHALVSLYKNKLINAKDLPIKLCAVTPCFRKEIGAHGVDTKGLYRVHQFNKVEQVVYVHPKNSEKTLKEMQSITEEFVQSLEIPYRVIEICSGDLGNKFAKQFDIEAWFPRQNKYGEITSAGSCTDYQARALNIKFQEGQEKGYVHILNNTMIATSRVMVAIIENFQQKDGSIKIPKALHPYTKFKEIKVKK